MPGVMEWLAKPTPIWVAGAAGLLIAGAELWRWAHGADTTPRRWSREQESATACYNTLTTETPTPGAPCFHRDAEKIGESIWSWVHPNVAVYSTAAPPRSSPTLRDLGDGAQAEAIRALEQDPDFKGKGWSGLADALDDSNAKAGERDPFRFDRVLIANVAKGVDWRPGDRMMWTRVLIEPINFSFAGYSVAATDNETVKVTSVEKTDTRKFSADIAATIPGMEGPKADINPSSEHTVKSNTDINAQYEKLGIDIMPNFLRIMRESETGGDAVGNTTVSLTAVTDPDMIWRGYPTEQVHRPFDPQPIVLLVTGTHFDDNGAPDGSSDKAKPVIDVLPQIRVPHCALRARVWMLYEERKVEDGRESYDESKQSVTLIHDAEDKQDEDIVSADEVSPAVWSLKLCKDALCTGDDLPLLQAKVQPAGSGPQTEAAWRKIVFTDYGAAIRVARSLRSGQSNASNNTSYKFNYPGDRGFAAIAPAKVSGDECKGEPVKVGAR